MNVVKVQHGEIKVDEALPWPLFDENDRLLLHQGYVITSLSMLDALLSRGVYRENNNKKNGNEHESVDSESSDKTSSPFVLISDYTKRLNSIFHDLEETHDNAVSRVLRLVDDLIWFADRDREVTLAVIHLSHSKKYGLIHPIHVALLCEIVASRLNTPEENRRSLLAAALTSNISMRNFQEMLQRQNSPLTASQQEQINSHPDRSHRILKVAGVEDELWLKIVLEHHEQLDGKGYPHGISDDAINFETRLLSIADRYTAMISKRAYREPFLIKDALREFFMGSGGAFDEVLCLQVIKELGVYPPGSFVVLNNNETAIVIKRSPGKSTTPTVKSIVGPDGKPYSTPLLRETSNSQHHIKEIINFQPNTPLNLDQIWGYA